MDKALNQADPYSLLFNCLEDVKILPPSLKKYFLHILENEEIHLEVNIFEEQANDLGYLRLLNDKSIDVKVKTLLTYLPLFNKTSPGLKLQYFQLLKNIYENMWTNNTNNNNGITYRDYYNLYKLASNHTSFTTAEQATFEDHANVILMKIDTPKSLNSSRNNSLNTSEDSYATSSRSASRSNSNQIANAASYNPNSN